jgi:hypothetical protein
MAAKMEITIKPAAKGTSVTGCSLLTWPTQNNTPPISIFTRAQITFTRAEDSPSPGGLAKGVGNLLPDTPLVKCGIALAKKRPAKKLAIKWYHSIVEYIEMVKVRDWQRTFLREKSQNWGRLAWTQEKIN